MLCRLFVTLLIWFVPTQVIAASCFSRTNPGGYGCNKGSSENPPPGGPGWDSRKQMIYEENMRIEQRNRERNTPAPEDDFLCDYRRKDIGDVRKFIDDGFRDIRFFEAEKDDERRCLVVTQLDDYLSTESVERPKMAALYARCGLSNELDGVAQYIEQAKTKNAPNLKRCKGNIQSQGADVCEPGTKLCPDGLCYAIDNVNSCCTPSGACRTGFTCWSVLTNLCCPTGSHATEHGCKDGYWLSAGRSQSGLPPDSQEDLKDQSPEGHRWGALAAYDAHYWWEKGPTETSASGRAMASCKATLSGDQCTVAAVEPGACMCVVSVNYLNDDLEERAVVFMRKGKSEEAACELAFDACSLHHADHCMKQIGECLAE